MTLLLIDNLDSFTYNIVQAFQTLQKHVTIVRANSGTTWQQCLRLQPQYITLGPGPGHPDGAALSLDIIKNAPDNIPILGICLGHQCMGTAFGASVCRAAQACHGKVSAVYHDGKTIFAGMPQGFLAMRYHSLAVEERSLPRYYPFDVTAKTTDGTVMGLRHRHRPMEGVQFHPESIGTPEGMLLLANFINYCRRGEKKDAQSDSYVYDSMLCSAVDPAA